MKIIVLAALLTFWIGALVRCLQNAIESAIYDGITRALGGNNAKETPAEKPTLRQAQ
jgi:hypothetical protein